MRGIGQGIKLECITPAEIDPSFEVAGCYCGDLLSYVMAHAKEGDVWLTSQTHQNIVAVAVLLNLPCIILVENKLPNEDTLSKAQREGIVLLGSSDNAFQLSGRLYALGLGR
ncbi:MAG: AraC family transcriptional regulator [Desulfotomaculaceae bacterium]|nr:AraC family transcriptional regulator [Desulfotomaculaceae bacterium]